MPPPYPRNLLITFDAFGTLFVPRLPISTQYALVAEEHGLSGMNEGDINASFQKAFKEESEQHPNYGKAADMKPEEWWKQIITKTFQGISRADIPQTLPPALIHRFRSNIGYRLYPDVIPLLCALRNPPYNWPYNSTSIRVITNSDSRVTSILNSLGVGVKPCQFTTPGGESSQDKGEECNALIDFMVLSYEIGFEKPDKRIFNEAKKIARDATGTAKDVEWSCIHVGDDREKDYHGARNAGWRGILVDRDGERCKEHGDVVKDLSNLIRVLM